MNQESTSYWQNLDTVTRSTIDQSEITELRIPGLTILSHADASRVGERSALITLASGEEVALSRLEPVFAAPGDARRRALADPHLSRRPVSLAPAPNGAVRLSIAESKIKVEADGNHVVDQRVFSASELERGVVLLLAEKIALLLHTLSPALPQVRHFGLIGESSGIVTVRQQIARVADLEVAALLRGETGTGKELVAKGIHEASNRSVGPFVAINMGAVPATLAAAELFGAAKGAFTGADRQRSGYFARAQGGTLFLDEIGETPPEVQVLLLRTLETGVIQPVGSEKPTRVDVRILAATDAQLEAEIDAGRFRAPLLHRLSGYEIRLPPLRERRDDIGRLLVHFLRQELETLGEARHLQDGSQRSWLPARLVARLASHRWPGNVRQLRNVARQLVIDNRGAARLQITQQIEALLEDVPLRRRSTDHRTVLEPEHPSFDEGQETSKTWPVSVVASPAAAQPEEATPTETPPPKRPRYRSPSEVSEDELLEALRAHGFRLQPTAAALGLSRTSLYALIDRSSRIRKARDLTADQIERSREAHGGNVDAMAAALEVSRKGLTRRMTQLGLR